MSTENSESIDTAAPDLTFGERAVGLSFNPSGDENVLEMKRRSAALIDNVNALREDSTDGEVKRMCSVAITKLQEAQMWVTKAQTWGK